MHNRAGSNTSYPDACGACGPVEEFVAEDRITHGFRHLGVVLAVQAEGSGPSCFCAGLAIPAPWRQRPRLYRSFSRGRRARQLQTQTETKEQTP